MTPLQADWLRKNKHYRAVPTIRAGNTTFVERGMLHPDGSFEKIVRGANPRVVVGSFEVGILKIPDDPGQR